MASVIEEESGDNFGTKPLWRCAEETGGEVQWGLGNPEGCRCCDPGSRAGLRPGSRWWGNSWVLRVAHIPKKNLQGGKQLASLHIQKQGSEMKQPKVSQLACGWQVFLGPKLSIFLACQAVPVDLDGRGNKTVIWTSIFVSVEVFQTDVINCPER